MDRAAQQAAREIDLELKKEQQQAIAAFVVGSGIFVALPTSFVFGVLPLCVLPCLRYRSVQFECCGFYCYSVKI